MRFNTLCLSLLVSLTAVYAKKNAHSFELGTSPYCKAENLTKHNEVYYASIAKELMIDESLCDKYVVAMAADSNSEGKYKIVKARIRDECEDCDITQIKLSSKAYKDLNGSKKSNVFWAILDKDGKMINGPFQPELSEKETQAIVNAYDGVNYDDLLKKFINNAKYMAKTKKANLKKLNNIKVEVIKKVFITKTDSEKAEEPAKEPAKEPVAEPTVAPVIEPVVEPVAEPEHVEHINTEEPIHIGNVEPKVELTEEPEETKEEEESSGTGVMTGAVAVSLAAGALLFVRRRSAKKNYIFGEPLDKLDGKPEKVLYANTKSGQKIKLEIPCDDFNDIGHIQIFSPVRGRGQDDVYNVHTQRAIMSKKQGSGSGSGDELTVNPQPRPHSPLPLPNNDFMMAFSPVEQPQFAAPKLTNINSTQETNRNDSNPYYYHFDGFDDDQEIYNSVPQSMNKSYSDNAVEPSTDIILDYVNEDSFYY